MGFIFLMHRIAVNIGRSGIYFGSFVLDALQKPFCYLKILGYVLLISIHTNTTAPKWYEVFNFPTHPYSQQKSRHLKIHRKPSNPNIYTILEQHHKIPMPRRHILLHPVPAIEIHEAEGDAVLTVNANEESFQNFWCKYQSSGGEFLSILSLGYFVHVHLLPKLLYIASLQLFALATKSFILRVMGWCEGSIWMNNCSSLPWLFKEETILQTTPKWKCEKCEYLAIQNVGGTRGAIRKSVGHGNIWKLFFYAKSAASEVARLEFSHVSFKNLLPSSAKPPHFWLIKSFVCFLITPAPFRSSERIKVAQRSSNGVAMPWVKWSWRWHLFVNLETRLMKICQISGWRK